MSLCIRSLVLVVVVGFALGSAQSHLSAQDNQQLTGSITGRVTIAQPGAPKPGTAIVSGRVMVNGGPARGVAVVMQPQQQYHPSSPSVVLRAKAGENGRFRFTGVAAGRYFIAALAPGFSVLSDNGIGPGNKTVSVSEGENVEDVEIELKRGGVITGRVTDAPGHPLTGQVVELTMINKDGSRWSFFNKFNPEMVLIDDRGVYRVYGLPEGRYLVSVGFEYKEGMTSIQSDSAFYPRTFHPDTTDESRAKLVEVTDGSENTGVDITVGEVKKTYDIAGRVVNADTGQPVAGVELAYGSVTDGGRRLGGYGSKGERSDAKGEFRLTGILPGKYAVFARGETDSDFYSEPAICDVSEGDVNGVEIRVRQGASISGFVVIEGANDPATLSKLNQIQLYASVRSNQLSAPGKEIVKVNADGSFRIRGLQPGKVDLSMSMSPRLALTLKGLSKLRVEYNGAPQRDGIELGPGEHGANVRFVVGYGNGIVRGQVKVVGGVLPEDFRLMVLAKRTDDLASWGAGAQVDARGQFVIESLTPGEYELQISVYSRAMGDSRAAQFGPMFSKAKERVVVSNGSEAQATLVVDLSRKEGSQ